jgi:hypothetical protein
MLHFYCARRVPKLKGTAYGVETNTNENLTSTLSGGHQ